MRFNSNLLIKDVLTVTVVNVLRTDAGSMHALKIATENKHCLSVATEQQGALVCQTCDLQWYSDCPTAFQKTEPLFRCPFPSFSANVETTTPGNEMYVSVDKTPKKALKTTSAVLKVAWWFKT